MHNTTLITFPIYSLRKIASPYDENGITTYNVVVDVKSLPDKLEEWRELNPRHADIKSGVAKQIASTLIDDPNSFFFRNRGLTLLAEKVIFDNKKNELSLVLSNRQVHGLLDGNHTFEVIRNHINSLSEDQISEYMAYIKVEIIEGVKDLEEAVNIVYSRNTSTQVKEQSKEELKKTFKEIHEVFEGKKYENRIAYREIEFAEDGSKKDIDIKEILSYLMCFDKEAYSDEEHPIRAYSNKSSLVEWYSENKKSGRILKYVPLLPKILELRDVIYVELPKAYNQIIKGKFGGLTGVVDTSSKKKMKSVILPFTGEESKYRIPSGFIYPVLAAMRNLIECSDNECHWIVDDPKEFFKENEVKGTLASRVCEQAKELRNPNKLGKDKATWGLCYDYVEKTVLKRK